MIALLLVLLAVAYTMSQAAPTARPSASTDDESEESAAALDLGHSAIPTFVALAARAGAAA